LNGQVWKRTDLTPDDLGIKIFQVPRNLDLCQGLGVCPLSGVTLR